MPAKAKERPGRILVIEDDWDILEVLKLMLEGEGHQVVTAKHGRAALAATAASKPFDLVVMDISMPEMSGIEVAQALRSDPRTAEVRIVLHTALDEHWVRARFVDYELFLTKANDADVLLDKIAQLLAQPRPSRAAPAAAEAAFSAEDSVKAQGALRAATGIGPESLALPAFLATLGTEIEQLRRVGKSDGEIAGLIGQAIGKPVAGEALTRHVRRA